MASSPGGKLRILSTLPLRVPSTGKQMSAARPCSSRSEMFGKALVIATTLLWTGAMPLCVASMRPPGPSMRCLRLPWVSSAPPPLPLSV